MVVGECGDACLSVALLHWHDDVEVNLAHVTGTRSLSIHMNSLLIADAVRKCIGEYCCTH